MATSSSEGKLNEGKYCNYFAFLKIVLLQIFIMAIQDQWSDKLAGKVSKFLRFASIKLLYNETYFFSCRNTVCPVKNILVLSAWVNGNEN